MASPALFSEFPTSEPPPPRPSPAIRLCSLNTLCLILLLLILSHCQRLQLEPNSVPDQLQVCLISSPQGLSCTICKMGHLIATQGQVPGSASVCAWLCSQEKQFVPALHGANQQTRTAPPLASSSEMLGEAEVNTQGWSVRAEKIPNKHFLHRVSYVQPGAKPAWPHHSLPRHFARSQNPCESAEPGWDVSSEWSPGTSDHASEVPTSGSG